MTLINWKSKESYIQEKVANGEALDMRREFFTVKVVEKLKQLDKNNKELTEQLRQYLQCKDNIDRLAQLTILLSKSQREYTMSQNQKPPIEHDEVVNNLRGLGDEYDITYNMEDGKLYIAYNGFKADGKTNSEVILQFVSVHKHPQKDKLVGLNIDKTRTSEQDGGRSGLLSGLFYIENLPIDLMEELPKVEEKEEKIYISKEIKMDNDTPEHLKGLSGKVQASLRAMTKVTKEGKIYKEDLYGLKATNPANLKAPMGLSRSERKEWWDALRKAYPEGFDSGGNWVGFGEPSVSEKPKEDPPSIHKKAVNTYLGLLKETGAGNLITSIIDKRVDERTCFIGRFFEAKKAYAIVSTPTEVGKEAGSAMLFFEKDRTANFVLDGLKKSPSWEAKLEGCQVYKASTLTQAIRSDRNRTIYFITNAVTALKALGDQAKKEIEDVQYEEVKD